MLTRLYFCGHPSVLATSLLEYSPPDVFLASETGEYIETSRILLATCSKVFLDVLAVQPTADCIILPEVPFRYVQLMFEVLQSGQVVSLCAKEAQEIISLAQQLQVPGTFSLVKEELVETCEVEIEEEDGNNVADREYEGDDTMEEEDDDVFASQDQPVYNLDNTALDLSPACRSKAPNPTHFSFEFPSKVKTNILTASTSSNRSSNITTNNPSSVSSLQRPRKPPPLKYLQTFDCQPPVQTPWTPLAASPVIEASFKKIVQQQQVQGQAESDNDERLRNLSVSSSDFDSLPGTPGPGSAIKKQNSISGSINLTAKSSCSRKTEPPENIKNVKQELFEQDEDITESVTSSQNLTKPQVVISDACQPSTTTANVQHSEPMLVESCSSVSPMSDSYSANIKGMQNLAPQLLLPALAKSLSPVQHMLLLRQQEIMQSTNKQIKEEERRQNMLSMVSKNSTKFQVNDSPSETKVKYKQFKTKQAEGEGRFKCEKCGKSYQWNYNLNRHMRFECGIGNRFQCGVCKRRFPHKQNAAIHLKRKHLVQVDSAEEMIVSGHIILLSNIPKKSSS